jgi:two-component system alkaline phosphatase synthesis response regulator PhoP
MQRPSKPRTDMRVDVARHEVWISNQEVELTRREWQLLLLLVARPGCLVTTERIFQEFFGDAWAEIDTRALSQHMARLRRKIGYERIETVPRFGFKFRGSVRVV